MDLHNLHHKFVLNSEFYCNTLNCNEMLLEMLKLKCSIKSEMRLLAEFKLYGSGMIIENQADTIVLYR